MSHFGTSGHIMSSKQHIYISVTNYTIYLVKSCFLGQGQDNHCAFLVIIVSCFAHVIVLVGPSSRNRGI